MNYDSKINFRSVYSKNNRNARLFFVQVGYLPVNNHTSFSNSKLPWTVLASRASRLHNDFKIVLLRFS